MESYFETKIPDFRIRFARVEDTGLILDFIKALAAYERLENEVVATEEILRRSLFERNQAEVVIGEYQGEPVTFALFFHNFSTFLGKANLYLEDLFVKPEARGRGFGKLMLACLARIACERDCGRLDWWCLDWNTSSIAFYQSLGAIPMGDWTVYRLEGEALPTLAKEMDRK